MFTSQDFDIFPTKSILSNNFGLKLDWTNLRYGLSPFWEFLNKIHKNSKYFPN